jgi:hypothetical protein
MNFGLIIIVVLFLSSILCSLVAGLRRWVSERKMRRKGFERALVCHEDERTWVAADREAAVPDISVSHSGEIVRRSKRKRLDKFPEPRLDRPRKGELDRLRKKLRITSGSLIYKHGAIYIVISEKKQRHWTWLGRWQKLKREIDE